VDFAADSIAYGQKELGLKNIRVGNLEHDSFEENYFDMVTLVSVMAHLDAPMDMLAKIRRVLRPGGVLLIWTVNAGSFRHKHSYERWSGFSPNHLIFFNRESILEALSKAGFSSIDIGNDHQDFDSMVKTGMIPAEHARYFEGVFKNENLGAMLAVLATRG
jgi:SAM-dependent methyltransferase